MPVNHITKEILLKLVYYGPGLGGKTSSLHYIHNSTAPESRSKMVQLATPVDRTLYFDFLPLEMPKVNNYALRLHLFTVPGQVYYNATRKLVLTGADGVVFVADSQQSRLDANKESLENLYENLAKHNVKTDQFPIVMQYNKRDLPNICNIEHLQEELNPTGLPYVESCAISGDGIRDGLKVLLKKIINNFQTIHAKAATGTDDSAMIKLLDFQREDSGITDIVMRYDGETVFENNEESGTSIGNAIADISDTSRTTLTPIDFNVPVSDRVSFDNVTEPNEPNEPTEQPLQKADRPTIQTPQISNTPVDFPEYNDDQDLPSLSVIGSSLTFSLLWPYPDRHYPENIEHLIREGQDDRAIIAIWLEIRRLVEDITEGLNGVSVESAIALLGLDGRRYLEIARLSGLADTEKAITPRALMRAYLFLLDLVSATEH